MQIIKRTKQDARVTATVVSLTVSLLVHDPVLFREGAGSLIQQAIGGIFLYRTCLNRH